MADETKTPYEPKVYASLLGDTVEDAANMKVVAHRLGPLTTTVLHR